MTELLKNRRTIRKYSNQDINNDLLDEILQCGTRASTTGNMQLYSIIVTRDAEMKEKMAPLHFNQPMVKDAPVTLTFCADFNRFNKWCRQRDAEPGYDNFVSFMTATIDALLVAQTVCVAAESKGLGICYLGTVLYTADKIIDLLNLPAGVVPVAVVTLGWPEEKPDQIDRISLKALVHNEQYRDYSKSDIDEIFEEKEARTDSTQFIKENNKKTLAQVFTDIRYKKGDNETVSAMLLELLHKQGFMQGTETSMPPTFRHLPGDQNRLV